ncbi:MAG: type II methionyl aminopeptidase [Euryarchaeota archaeon]|nr:type II methionyl aminopeptidase [Euryarchaeota archaeon]|tara:strand:+ start:58 stop:1071 length:1014 start_codon:yes stop_codon:yes gene_type:complete
MLDESNLKYWQDAGHVARRTLEAIKDEITVGKTWHSVIESAERFIRRNGGNPAFPATIAVNEFAAHYTTDHALISPEGWEDEMVFKNGDLVKLDVGVHINGHIGDNALTIEIGNKGKHTEQIKAARESRDAAIEMLHPGTPWYKVGAAAAQPTIDAGFQPIRNLCGHQLKPWELHAGVSVPSYACGPDNPGFKGVVEEGAVYAVEPFNTSGDSGMIVNVGKQNSSNIYRVARKGAWRKALARKQLKPLGAQLARNFEERYSTLPFAERWAYPMLEKPFPEADEESRQSKWNALVKKLTSIQYLETYHALACKDGGMIGQFEHTAVVTAGGPEILTVE